MQQAIQQSQQQQSRDKGVRGRILIVDEDEIFSHSVSTLLRQEGYKSFSASDIETAILMLEAMDYDLLIAGTQIASKLELELLRKGKKELPLILISDYPSRGTEIESRELPVIAYMTKPVAFDRILLHIKSAMEDSGLYRTSLEMKQRLQESVEELEMIDKIRNANHGYGSALPADSFLDLNYYNILGSLLNLIHLRETFNKQPNSESSCHLFNCPRLSALKEVLTEAIDVINKTKSSFKSKDLGELRTKLEEFVRTCE